MKKLSWFLGLVFATQAFASFVIPDGAVVTAKLGSQAVTTAKIADANVTPAKLSAANIVTSSDCGSFVTSSGSYVAVTNLSVSITTNGRPVEIALRPTPGNLSAMNLQASGQADFRFLRASTDIGTSEMSATTGYSLPPSAFSVTDTPAAGTYTYSMQIKSSVGGQCFHAFLQARET